ncbi:Uncharacterized protein C30D11.14c [Beauveria bassiana]|uniref:Uncharacterized protein C30D11.14c n=1 Tax=Beauveria bassiana TaxID=176275 RepID=A0A2N6P1A4_BEABA|nr:Uncharacterized protein C30D11.14c [Beauveria bassiana]
MADAEPRKHSRFDQKEPEPKRASRFDRRSRSPSTRNSETRERSPLPSTSEPTVDPAAAAAAAAAKINAQLQARKGIQHVDVPPILGATSNGTPEASSAAPEASKGAPGAPGEMYVSDGDYIQDIEVNDLRNRYMLMKAQTQQAEPPLYLHITARTKEVLEAAVAKVNELIEQELPQLVDERRFKRREREQPENDDTSRRNKWPEESIPVGLEPVPGFNLRAQIVGAGGSYVKHIQQETGCRVQIKGRGSGYIERDTNQESDEEMFLHVAYVAMYQQYYAQYQQGQAGATQSPAPGASASPQPPPPSDSAPPPPPPSSAAPPPPPSGSPPGAPGGYSAVRIPP